jgi:hypothetical protein
MWYHTFAEDLPRLRQIVYIFREPLSGSNVPDLLLEIIAQTVRRDVRRMPDLPRYHGLQGWVSNLDGQKLQGEGSQADLERYVNRLEPYVSNGQKADLCFRVGKICRDHIQ